MSTKLWAGCKLEDFTKPELITAFVAKAAEIGIDIAIVSIGRTLAVQLAYYAQGRLPLEQINGFRTVAGLPAITENEAGNVITWTITSKHITDKVNVKSRAFDIVVLKNGNPVWSNNIDTNSNGNKDYLELAKIGKELGLYPGAYWATPDLPHYQTVA